MHPWVIFLLFSTTSTPNWTISPELNSWFSGSDWSLLLLTNVPLLLLVSWKFQIQIEHVSSVYNTKCDFFLIVEKLNVMIDDFWKMPLYMDVSNLKECPNIFRNDEFLPDLFDSKDRSVYDKYSFHLHRQNFPLFYGTYFYASNHLKNLVYHSSCFINIHCELVEMTIGVFVGGTV